MKLFKRNSTIVVVVFGFLEERALVLEAHKQSEFFVKFLHRFY